MFKSTSILIGFLCLFLIQQTQAQNDSFFILYSRHNAYNNLTESTSLNNGVAWDDPDFEIPIGFDFVFLGDTINTIYISPVFLGGGLTTTKGLGFIYNFLLAYGSDIIDRGGEYGPSLSNISYKAETNVYGQRILKIEWNNVGFYNELDAGSNNQFLNFQLWLYEGTNEFEVRFGPSEIANGTFVHDGFAGPPIGYGKNLNIGSLTAEQVGYVSGTVDRPTLVSLNTTTNFENILNFLEGNPRNGAVYLFVPTLFTAIQNVQTLKHVSAFPTQVNDYLQINNDKNKAINISISDSNGKIVLQKQTQQSYDRIDMSALPIGIYLVHLQHEQEQITYKVVKF